MSLARSPKGITDHDLFVVTPYDHHAEAEYQRVICNGLSIPPGDYQYRITWARSNHIVTAASLIGSGTYIPGGGPGAWASGTQTPGEGGAQHLAGGGLYIYVASFMRLHGDAYLSQPIFGTGIRLKDIYLDGADTVLLFYNSYASNRTLRFWGLVWAK